MKAVINILQNDATLIASLTGGANAVYIGHAEQGQKTPYISVESSMDDAYVTKEQASTLQKESYSIAVYAADFGTVETVADNVIAALDNKANGTYNGQVMTSCKLQSRDRLGGVEANNSFWLEMLNFNVITK